jgi:hypothetical protein
MTDLELLEEAESCGRLSDAQLEIVDDMSVKLERKPLTPAQRAFVQAMIDGVRYEKPEETPLPASAYPRGREVPDPPALAHRPLKPPGRR